jgi:hypothetical protein
MAVTHGASSAAHSRIEASDSRRYPSQDQFSGKRALAGATLRDFTVIE